MMRNGGCLGILTTEAADDLPQRNVKWRSCEMNQSRSARISSI